MNTDALSTIPTPPPAEVSNYLGLARVQTPPTSHPVAVHVGLTPDFSPTAETRVGTVAGGGVVFASLPYGEERWVRVTPLAAAGPPSEAVRVVTRPIGDSEDGTPSSLLGGF